MKSRGFPKVASSPDSSALVQGGAGQRSIDPPFPMESEPLPIEPIGQIPPAEETNSPLLLIVKLVGALLSGDWLLYAMLALNTGMYLWDWYRAWLTANGKAPLLSDAQKKEIADFLGGLLNRPNPPANP
jgi:hypothetical protein